MTRKEWTKLTNEERQIKVAKLVGGFTIEDKINGAIPDYLNDLNAMHKAELQADTSQEFNYDGRIVDGVKKSYVQWLDTIIHDGYAECEKSTLALISATAAQRAEAFVLTMEGRYA